MLRVLHPLDLCMVLLSADGSVLTGVPFQGGVGLTCIRPFWRGVYLRVFHYCVMVVCVLTGVPLLCDGCVYTYGCSTTGGCVGIYSVTCVPLLCDGCVYTYGCSTAGG